MAFENMTPLTPENLAKAEAENNPVETPAVETPAVETPSAQETPPAETTPPAEPPKPDEFIENFNKRYNTQYKTDDEIKPLFTLSGKITELEGKVKDRDELSKSVEQYKKELEETKTTYMSDLLSKPLIKQAFVASQLQERYPDKDRDVLAQVVMSDIDKMSDIEAIAKEKMISVKGLTFEEARLAKLADFGVDLEQKPEEWDSVAKARIKIGGAEARERIKDLIKGIELPKFPTKEEREAQQVQLLEDKKKALTPFKEIFRKFDEYQNGDFKFAVDDEFKSGLDDIFDGIFIDSGFEVNEKNLATAELLKKALFVEENLSKMLEIKEKEVEARVKAEYDKLLNNETPPNTATATDQTPPPEESGISDFLRGKQDVRAKKF